MQAPPAPTPRRAMLTLAYLGSLAGVQAADPNIASSALLSAGTALRLGNLSALAASVSTFMLAATVITTGMLADRLGRRRILLAGFLATIAGDVIASTASDPWTFIVGRAIAGVGLGAVYGAAFAYIREFAVGKGGLAGAMGLFSAVGALTALVASFGGATLVAVDWRYAFLLIPAFCAVGIVVALALVPRDRPAPPATTPWDLVGQALLGLGVIAFLDGISHMSARIASPYTVVPLALGVVLLGAWVVWERARGARAFFPIGLFRNPVFLAAVATGLTYNMGQGALLLSFSNLFQYANDLRPGVVSLLQLPYLVTGIAAALVIGRLVGGGRLSQRGAILLGGIVTGAGCALFAVLAALRPEHAAAFIPALVLVGAGVVIPAVPYGSLILQEADEEHYGVVASSRSTIGQFWYALGLAGSTVIIDTWTRTRVDAELGPQALAQLDGWAVSGSRPSDPDVLATAAHAFSGGFAAMALVLGVLGCGAGVVGWLLMRRAEAGRAATSSGA